MLNNCSHRTSSSSMTNSKSSFSKKIFVRSNISGQWVSLADVHLNTQNITDFERQKNCRSCIIIDSCGCNTIQTFRDHLSFLTSQNQSDSSISDKKWIIFTWADLIKNMPKNCSKCLKKILLDPILYFTSNFIYFQKYYNRKEFKKGKLGYIFKAIC